MNKPGMTEDKRSRGRLAALEPRGDAVYALIAFVSRAKGDLLARTARAHQAVGVTIAQGRGTARSEVLAYLGLELDEKAIVFSYVPADRAQAALQSLRHRLDMDQPGHGIAFLIPVLDSRGLKASFRFAEQVDRESGEGAPRVDPHEVPDEGIVFAEHDMIIAAVGTGTAEQVMDWARDAGASGGTIIESRRRAVASGTRASAASYTPRDLLLMLVQKKLTEPIIDTLKSRLSAHGVGTSTVCALPISAVIGLSKSLVVQGDGSVRGK